MPTSKKLLNILVDCRHNVHYIAFDKKEVDKIDCEATTLCFNPSHPYELGFDYLITYINWYVKEKLGKSARGLIILDEKREQHDNIEKILTNRRFKTIQTHRVKWIVEFGYPVDSKKNPMIQLSDLVIYCTKRFIEIENGYRDSWGQDAKNFYAQCYKIINDRLAMKGLKERGEGSSDIKKLNEYLSTVRATPNSRWESRYMLKKQKCKELITSDKDMGQRLEQKTRRQSMARRQSMERFIINENLINIELINNKYYG